MNGLLQGHNVQGEDVGLPLHQGNHLAFDVEEGGHVALLLALVHLHGHDLSPPGLLVEEGVHHPVLTVDHVEGARHLLVRGGEEDLARDELGSCT